MAWRRELGYTLDASMKMPEQYGSRGYWRYQHVSALIGFVFLPVALLFNIFSIPAAYQNVATVALVAFLITATVFFVRRDRLVQKRIDETGSPITDKEPY